MVNSALWYREFGVPEEVLRLEHAPPAALTAGSVRVEMRLAPVNASDLIPLTGAYRHRVTPPAVAGYEGIGVVTEATPGAEHLLGKRVLPLRGEGTWQRYVSCPAALAVPVPEAIADPLASRAYINPLAALLMLDLYNPAGRRVLLTAAGSDCARLLGQWALQRGATAVAGICRSPAHADSLAACGITPVAQSERARIDQLAATADIVFDATGGVLAQQLLEAMRPDGLFVCYGLLSGQTFALKRHYPPVRWFHIRNYLADIAAAQWHALFRRIWPLLAESRCGEARIFPQADWREALALYRQPGRQIKPVMSLQP
ncbi:zinc-dependent alcohol dehydrogenase family protein [Serratia rhizosphaerae]